MNFVKDYLEKKEVRKVKKVLAILHVVLITPIWFYLLYQILQRVEATELMMFLFWVYLPASIIASVIAKIVIDES